MAVLSKLPQELIELIIHELDPLDLLSTSRLSLRWARTSQLRWFSFVVITHHDDAKALLAVVSESPRLAQAIRGVCVIVKPALYITRYHYLQNGGLFPSISAFQFYVHVRDILGLATNTRQFNLVDDAGLFRSPAMHSSFTFEDVPRSIQSIELTATIREPFDVLWARLAQFTALRSLTLSIWSPPSYYASAVPSWSMQPIVIPSLSVLEVRGQHPALRNFVQWLDNDPSQVMSIEDLTFDFPAGPLSAELWRSFMETHAKHLTTLSLKMQTSTHSICLRAMFTHLCMQQVIWRWGTSGAY